MKHKILLGLLLFLSLNIFTQNISSNLETYCKVWGVCKYYSDNNVDWDNVFFENYESIINLNNRVNLNNQLLILFQKTGFKFAISNDTSITSATLFRNWGIKDTVKYCLKTNFDWISNSKEINTVNKNKLIQLVASSKKRKPRTVSIESQGRIKHDKEKIYNKFNEKIALLSLFRVYNTLEYYYPYKHLMDNPWNKTIEKVIPEFITSTNENEYLKALNLLSSYIQDSHVWIKEQTEETHKNKNEIVKEKYPIDFDFAEDKLFISNILSDSISNLYHIKIGDVITKVNDLSVETLIGIVSKQTSCSNKQAVYDALVINLHHKDNLKLSVLQNGVEEELVINKCKFTQTSYIQFIYKHNNKEISKEINDEIGYIYLPNSKYSTIDNVFRKYKDKETIILDCRGYGSMATLKLPKLLSKKPRDVAMYFTPTKKIPGLFEKAKKNETYYISNNLDFGLKLLFNYKRKIFPTLNTPYKGKVVVLIDENAMSFGETVIMLIKAYADNPILIGRPTKAANGNVVQLTLPMGEELNYTGIDFRFADGTELQRKGIQPDIYVLKTKEAIINGEDEILDAALKYIKDGRKD